MNKSKLKEKYNKDSAVSDSLIKSYLSLYMRNIITQVLFVVAFLIVFFFLYRKNETLNEKLSNNVLVMQDNKIYNAIKVNNITESKVIGFIFTSLKNMFEHNQYNYKERLEIAQSFFSKKAFNFIVTRFNSDGNILDKYVKFDASMEYDFSPTDIKIDYNNSIVRVYGIQRFVFADVKPKEISFNLRLKIKKTMITSMNPFGLQIDEVNTIK